MCWCVGRFDTRVLIQLSVSQFDIKIYFNGFHSGTEEECSTEACKDAASRLRFYMDTSVDPCENFYDFACGAFHEKTTIPEGTLAAGALIDMMLKSHETLYEVLGAEGTSDEPTAFKSVRNYYRTCKENKNNLEDLKSLLNKTGVFPVVLGDSWEEQNFKWDEAVKQLAKEGIPINTGTGILVPLIKVVDEDASKRLISVFSLSATELPMPITNEFVKKYENYLVRIAVLLGAKESEAEEDMKAAIEFEKKLLEIITNRPEPTNMTINEAAKLFPGFNMLEYIKGILGIDNLEGSEVIKISDPKYIRNLGGLLNKTSGKAQANYLGFKAILPLMYYTSEETTIIQQEWQKFKDPSSYADTQKMNPERFEPYKNRTTYCMKEVANLNGGNTYQNEAGLTNAVGSMFIRKSFSKEEKEGSLAMINGIKAQFKEMLQELDWMDDETKNAALDKESNMGVYVGYVDELFDEEIMNQFYSNLDLMQDSYLKNFLMLQKFNNAYFASEYKKELQKDIKNWNLHGVTYMGYNAWYSASVNAFTVPAARVSPPLHGLDFPKFWNYGAAGWASAHEVVHAFDNDGKNFDANGNKRNWWTPKSEAAFNNRTKCLEDLYNTFSIKIDGEDIKMDGKKTLAENIADYGGMKATYRAYKQAVKSDMPEKRLPGLDYSPDQLLWVAGAHAFCIEYRDQRFWNGLVKNDIHSPSPVRVNGVFSGMKEFAADWNCPAGSVMNPSKRCTIY